MVSTKGNLGARNMYNTFDITNLTLSDLKYNNS